MDFNRDIAQAKEFEITSDQKDVLETSWSDTRSHCQYTISMLVLGQSAGAYGNGILVPMAMAILVQFQPGSFPYLTLIIFSKSLPVSPHGPIT